MKSLKLSLALVVSLGLSSAAQAHQGSACCPEPDPCCGHGLLSKLKLHRCNTCCEAPKPCPAPCDPCGGHKLLGMLKCIRLPQLGGCCDAPKCCEPKPCPPKPCKPKCCKPKCEPKCDPCDPCGGGILSKLRGMLHRDSCCEAPKPACDPCNTCGHKLNLGRLFGKRCCPCDGVVTEVHSDAPAAAPAPTPAPKPMGAGASSSGLLILSPAG